MTQISKAIVAATLMSATLFGGNVLAAGNIEAGKAKAAACFACHGENGQSTMPAVPGMVVPNLGGQYADYLAQTLRDYRSGKRQNANMNGMSAGLSDEDIENISAYFASQSGLSTVKHP